MGLNVTLAFLHHVAVFLLFAAVMAELVLIRGELTIAMARSLLRMDAVYGISATVVLVVGFLRVFLTEKGAAYYFHSAPFIAKISLFVVIGFLSIYPTRQFLSWRGALRQDQVPVLSTENRRAIRRILHTELTLLVLMILCAVLMARGIGYLGTLRN